MGIPKLLTTLTPYGERGPLNGARFIIDGPALAYHAVSICLADPVMSAGRNHPLDQPTYGQLGQAAIAWLDGLRDRNIDIEVLYFDGYLPEEKRPVRLERSWRTSAQLKSAFVFYQRDNLPGFDVKGPRTGSLLPAPAFAVPAVLDALRGSPLYGPRTVVVPGEADTFCVEHARTRGGGIIVTSDSDLLIQDLGPDAGVVLFRDIDLRNAAPGKPLTAITYVMPTMCKKLGLSGAEEMRALAFGLSMDLHVGKGELVERARRDAAGSQYPREYAEFVEQFAYPRALVEAVKNHNLNGLDPRVSEVVVQAVSTTKPCDGDIDILAFAPPLLDSGTRTTAWDASASIRCHAFSLLQIIAMRRIKCIYECARMASAATRGSPMDLVPITELGETLSAFLGVVRRVRTAVDEPVLQWAVLASYQDIRWSRTNAKEATCLEVLSQETPANGVTDRVTWNAVHWLAQIQGTLYSLRIMRQVAAFVRQATDTAALGPILDEIEDVLAPIVPPLADFPMLRVLRDLPARLKSSGALELLAKLTDVEGGIAFKKASKKNKSRNKRKRTDRGSGPARAGSNPFALLDGME